MTGWRGADEIACTAGTVPDPGENASIDRLWSAKTKTVVDPLNHFSYIDLALASGGSALCIVHPIPARPAAALPGPDFRHAAGRAVRLG